MSTKIQRLGGNVCFVIVVGAAAVFLSPPTAANAITFDQWATGLWDDDVAPGAVYADSASIDSLAGIGNYDWTTTPTKLLYLDGNQITSVQADAFSGLDDLELLALGSNQIAAISTGAFNGLGNLTSLQLFDNQLTSIASGDFNGLGSLSELELSSNLITSIDSGDFSGLENLTHLIFDDNQITTIEAHSFSGMNSMVYLSLLDNQITSVDTADFSGLNNLVFLDMDNNQISSIETGDFSELGQVEILFLSNNSITDIGASAFGGMGNLQDLNLSGNQIANIESGAFSGLVNLQVLHLANNNTLTDLNLDASDFSSLTVLNAANTNINRTSLKDAQLNQTSLAALFGSPDLAGITEVDLGEVDFASITDLSPLYAMDNLTDLWMVAVSNMDADKLDTLLDELDTMEASGTEGTLYMTQSDFDELNAVGDGKLAAWDAEAGHHLRLFDLGDFNLDGVVNVIDLGILATNYGTTSDATWWEGDADGDGMVNVSDLGALATNYGAVSVSAVPEPGMTALMGLGVLVMLVRRCKWYGATDK